jgi:hypothetical protein
MTKQWLSQEQIDNRMRERIAGQLSKDIAAYNGSPGAAKEILRGLAAAREMGIELGPFEDALTERHRALDAA